MNRLENLEQYIYDNGINLIDNNRLKEKSMIFKDFRTGYITIIINSNNIKSTAEKLRALTHEVTHHKRNAFHLPYMPKIHEWRIEYEVKVDTVYELVPFEDLRKLLRNESYRCEIAKYFGIPEDFVDEAVHVYQRKGNLPYWGGLPLANRPAIPAQENIPEPKPPSFHANRSRSKKQYEIRSHIKYSDYVKVMKRPDILCDQEAAEELHITIGFLNRVRYYFRKKGLAVRRGEFNIDWRNYSY